ncbi:5-(carboxyamino)imidazole ribonucleotide synthase [Pelagerythrobacter marinus]|uniref:5-(carboxyamino)imidazole ribonucleotide synthase n=1 Tax=Pelagerythrobacter marinus TaxID=538382 RepID=UPI002036FA55|nr:5-(carboxyamino)imidazole ribonucleotide synthase [Pelagerythrobacter marinus]USA39087.1 5-(carboxyamino)imidazole ribonucleotide synthase [Pelagerythrobacter marinus]WPZ06826.1 5-(carboxyamino)imidazole ribonucleotide synthase [Pelagerythrobacter marinus]
MIAPGGTIGILGGGQLGRMMAIAAAQLGYRCHVYEPGRDSVAAEVSAQFTCAPWHDEAALARFAEGCDVVTWEFENVPVAPLAPIEGLLAPHPRALETAQDRLKEKRFVEGLGGVPAAYAPVDSAHDLAAAVDRIGAPGILKTRRDGYDGKGQWRIQTARDADAIRVPDAPTIYEGFVEFACEFSVILVRGRDGEVRFWDSAENTHVGGILATSTLPASAMVAEQVPAARDLAAQVAEALGYVGVLTLEFFATAEGPVFNEMAPRVHNSGHWTIEGAATSQFENHVRAICGLPLGDTATTAGQVVMTNIIGEDAQAAHECLGQPGAHLHLYGKRQARAGRKMGHVTRIGAG